MNCESLAERLTELMEGELNESEEAAALEHLATCNSCEQVLAETREVLELAKAHGRTELTNADRERMLKAISLNAVALNVSDRPKS